MAQPTREVLLRHRIKSALAAAFVVLLLLAPALFFTVPFFWAALMLTVVGAGAFMVISDATHPKVKVEND